MENELTITLPLWVLADAMIVEMESAPKVAMVKSPEGKWIAPVFTDEAEAKRFLQNVPLPGQCPLPIGDMKYLVDLFEFLRTEGLTGVHLFAPAPEGVNRYEMTAEAFIEGMREQLPTS